MPRRRLSLLWPLLLASLLLASCDVLTRAAFGPADASGHGAIRFKVEKGDTARALGPRLEEAGLVSSAARWTLFLRSSRGGACLKAGDFLLRPDQSMADILETLCGTPLPEDIPVTVVEGWRIVEIDEALASAGLIVPGAYRMAVADPRAFETAFPVEGGSLEGYLFPETYMVVPARFEVRAFVERQLQAFEKRFYLPHAGELGARTLHEVVVMASMVEREEPEPAMRPRVAGVLWKRLDQGWNLGVDATSRYTLKDWNDRKAFLRQLRDHSDPYNTRLRQGLPPTAIGNPGIVALEAALASEASDAWYYLHDASRVVHFGRNAAEHEANRRRYGVW